MFPWRSIVVEIAKTVSKKSKSTHESNERETMRTMRSVAEARCAAASAGRSGGDRRSGSQIVTLPPKPSNASIEVTLPTWNLVRSRVMLQPLAWKLYITMHTAGMPSTGTFHNGQRLHHPGEDCHRRPHIDPATNDGGESVVAETVELADVPNAEARAWWSTIGTTQHEGRLPARQILGPSKSHTGYHVLLGGPTISP